MKSVFLLWGCALSFTLTAAASELEYPELVVTPRATERVQSEAAKEKNKRWFVHVPIQISAIATLTASIMQESKLGAKDTNEKGFGTLIGGGWLVGTLALSAFHTPYLNAYQEYARMPAKTPREQLARERIAEEAMRDAGKLESRLAWLSFASNFLASGYLLAKVEKNTVAMGMDIFSLIASATPLIFESRWESVASDHMEYKKKIYGPIASTAVFQDSASKKFVPGLALTMNF